MASLDLEDTAMLPTRVLYYGTDEPLPERAELWAGPLSLVYEEGDLRYIRLGEREILRRVYVAIRDRNWGTVRPRFSNVRQDVAKDSFRISYDVENQQGEIDFFWKGTITGDAQGTVTIAMEGTARSTFLRNRIGFCVLHPIWECASQACTVEKVDGSVVQGAFPLYISPDQPFLDIRAISHEVVPGVRAEVRFAGDVFEMEDQRNWTDASYKTYCTPLRLPFPVEIKAGTRVSQSVTLTLKGKIPTPQAETPSAALTFTVGRTVSAPLPRIGLAAASHSQVLSQKALARLRALNLSHLRVDLRLSQPDFQTILGRASTEASELRVPLEVSLHLSDAAEEELKRLRSVLERVKPAVCAWLIFHVSEKSTTEKRARLARRYLANYDPQARIGAGTNAYFAELNRDRPPVNVVELVSYSLNPQVHAFDNATLVENLAAQAASVESARQFAGGLPLAVTPITLKPRFNPNATGPEPEPRPGELPSQVDVRQMSLFGAGWTAASLKYLAESGAYSLTYYETTGWRGVMETEQGSPLPAKFRSLAGSVFPLYHVLADVGEFAGGSVVPSASSAPLKVDGLILRQGHRTRILLANFSAEPQTVRVTDPDLSQSVQVKYLDETNAELAMVSPESFRAEMGQRAGTSRGELELRLRPYALARIDTEMNP
jgi:hypothetical protein